VWNDLRAGVGSMLQTVKLLERHQPQNRLPFSGYEHAHLSLLEVESHAYRLDTTFSNLRRSAETGLDHLTTISVQCHDLDDRLNKTRRDIDTVSREILDNLDQAARRIASKRGDAFELLEKSKAQQADLQKLEKEIQGKLENRNILRAVCLRVVVVDSIRANTTQVRVVAWGIMPFFPIVAGPTVAVLEYGAM
jgi:hypothetical protein